MVAGGCSVRGRSRTGSGLLVERVGVLGQLAGGGAREAAETETGQRGGHGRVRLI